jgi:hypothetical protein
MASLPFAEKGGEFAKDGVSSSAQNRGRTPFPFVVGGRYNQFYLIEQIGLDVAETDDAVDTEDDP